LIKELGSPYIRRIPTFMRNKLWRQVSDQMVESIWINLRRGLSGRGAAPIIDLDPPLEVNSD
jgi:hypothetical protein